MGDLIQFNFFIMIGIPTALTVYQGDKKESLVFFNKFKNISSFGQASLAQVLRIWVQVYFSPETLGEF